MANTKERAYLASGVWLIAIKTINPDNDFLFTGVEVLKKSVNSDLAVYLVKSIGDLIVRE